MDRLDLCKNMKCVDRLKCHRFMMVPYVGAAFVSKFDEGNCNLFVEIPKNNQERLKYIAKRDKLLADHGARFSV